MENFYLRDKFIVKMRIVEGIISRKELSELAQDLYGDMVKAVADVDRKVLAIDAELHSDLERLLLESGSSQNDLWGFNLYPEQEDEDFIEFDSLINIRPRQKNMSRDVEDPEIRKAIVEIVNSHVK